MATFTQEELEELLHGFEDNPHAGQDLCSDIDLFEVALPQPPSFSITPRPMDTTHTLEAQLAETQNELRSVKRYAKPQKRSGNFEHSLLSSAFEDSMKTVNELVQLRAELRLMKSLVERLVHYIEQLGPWTAEVTAALQKLGEPPLSAT
ncbi:hypothetical protein ACJ73_02994 [Blastomyces percursus]|uniref:Uncharacterized protein n=1 Tax=Blastomyces percursus TaxID=1658174 RepID=A0A1J9QAS8_9EURO|nr:hypothetical protein ACJ73_02994 [Blastomyces percursus]